MPNLRLGMFFAAVVLVGNLLMAAVYVPPSGQSETSGPRDYLDRKVRRIRRAIDRVRVKLFEGMFRSEGALRGRVVLAGDLVPEPVLQSGDEDVLAAARSELNPWKGMALSMAGSADLDPGRYLHRVVDPALLRLEAMVLPELPRDPFEMPVPEPYASALKSLDLEDLCPMAERREAFDEWVRSRQEGWMEGILDNAFHVPRTVGDGVMSVLSSWFPRSGQYSLREENDSAMLSRVLQWREPARREPPFREFLKNWAEREQRHFAGHAEYLLTSEVLDGTADVDEGDLQYEQRKILWDVIRRTYLTAYLPKAEERLKEDAWRFADWKVLDVIVAPPVLAAYTWYRGWERKFTVAGTKLRISIEPFYRIKQVYGDDRDDLVAAAAVEWEVPGVPLRLIVSGGLHDGDPELDFIGIGTSLGMAKRAVKQRLLDEDPEDE